MRDTKTQFNIAANFIKNIRLMAVLGVLLTLHHINFRHIDPKLILKHS
jgi:hypothetical protein